MDFQGMQPSYYIPVYLIPGEEFPVHGKAVRHLPTGNNPVSASENLPVDQDDTLRPSSSAATARQDTSMLTDMDVTMQPTNASNRMATDTTVESVRDVTMQSAEGIAAHRPDAMTANEDSDSERTEDDEMNDDETDDDEEDDNAIFAPIPIKEHARSCDGFSNGETTLGLPNHIYRSWKANGYNDNWLAIAGVSENILNEFTSKIKMESLLLKGALQINDELYIIIKFTQDGTEYLTEKSARITSFHNTSRPSKPKLPDFLLSVAGTQRGVFNTCNSPTALLDALSNLHPQSNKPSFPFKQLNVRRAGQELGTLHDVRQKYHRWEIEMDAWSVAKNVSVRRRRRVGKVGGE